MFRRYRGDAVLVLYFTFVVLGLSASRSTLPATRRFLTLPVADLETSSSTLSPLILRVLQFNALADGLSGLRPDLGHFNRASKDFLVWEHRKSRILHEITQYEPDIITMQEVDHYYDFFLPELSVRGYTGFFAPKPTSACLEVSENEDGCAMFVKRSKLRVISCESKTLALSIAGLNTDGELVEDDKSIKAQSQVGLIAVCEICNWQPPAKNGTSSGKRVFTLDEYDKSNIKQEDEELERQNSPPPIIISTTHLKSSKSYTGERYRQKGMQIRNNIYVVRCVTRSTMHERLEYSP
jgi:Endonuclease/Exonuclease/phosphatase family